MITTLLIMLVSGFVSVVFGLFPELPDPDAILDGTSGIGSVFSSVGSLAFWVPFPAAAAALAVVAAVAVAAFGIKLVRIVASFLTAGGGSAA